MTTFEAAKQLRGDWMEIEAEFADLKNLVRCARYLKQEALSGELECLAGILNALDDKIEKLEVLVIGPVEKKD